MKLAIVIRKDLKLPKGKMAVQAAHAAVEAAHTSEKSTIKEWRQEGGRKIAVYAESLEHLYKLQQDAKQLGLNTTIISDAGKTVVAPGTVTCMGIGPDDEDKVDKIIKDLQLV